jgi:hypothetical protein
MIGEIHISFRIPVDAYRAIWSCDLANAAARQLPVTTAGCDPDGASLADHLRQMACIASISSLWAT